MDHSDHVGLISEAIGGGTTWADLGSGTGAFTLAMAELLGPGATIYSVDRDPRALEQQASAMRQRFPSVEVHAIVDEFAKNLDLPVLDGVVMANSLHFERDNARVVSHVIRYLRPGGRFVLVEYDADRGHPWGAASHLVRCLGAIGRERWTPTDAAHRRRILVLDMRNAPGRASGGVRFLGAVPSSVLVPNGASEGDGSADQGDEAKGHHGGRRSRARRMGTDAASFARPVPSVSDS